MKYIFYKEGYKYQLARRYNVDVPIEPDESISTTFIKLSKIGRLTIEPGYAWDGPSGPTIDTSNFMRGSLVHDALYQLMREEELDSFYRDRADRILQQMCKEDGMSSFRAWYVYKSLVMFGGDAADPDNVKQVIKAPVNTPDEVDFNADD